MACSMQPAPRSVPGATLSHIQRQCFFHPRLGLHHLDLDLGLAPRLGQCLRYRLWVARAGSSFLLLFSGTLHMLTRAELPHSEARVGLGRPLIQRALAASQHTSKLSKLGLKPLQAIVLGVSS